MAHAKGVRLGRGQVEVCAAGGHNVLGLWTTIQLALRTAG